MKMCNVEIWKSISVLALFSLLLSSSLLSYSTANATDNQSVNRIELNSIDSSVINADTIDLQRLLIGVEPGKSDDEIRSILAGRGLKLVKHWPSFGGALVEINGALNDRQLRASSINAQQALSALEQTRVSLEQVPEFRYVTYNAKITAASAPTANVNSNANRFASVESATPPLVEPLPNDPEFANQWALNIIRVVDSWNISQGDPNVVVAVIDSGYNVTHPDLDNASLWTNPIEAAGTPGFDDDNNGLIDDKHGWDWIDNDNVTNDTFGHGTHVGGTIAATSNNQIGISGIGRNIKVLPLRILDSQGSGYIADLIDALKYAEAKGVRIANLSLVLPFDSPMLSEVIDDVSDDIMIVAATGNVSANVYWPAAYRGTIAVAATDEQDTYETFSNSGPAVDLAGPGADILSTGKNSDYVDNTGTSMATPHVSALAALVSSLRPDFSNRQILDIIEQSAIDINIGVHRGRDDYIGHGRVDVYQSLLNASVGLELHDVDPTDGFAFARYPVEYNISVNTPASATQATLPVQGAVVHYKLIPNGATSTGAQTISGRVLSGADGIADIVFLAPIDTGSYVLRTQLGQESVDFPLTVYPVVSELDLTLATSEVEAGNGFTTVSVEALDSNGNRMMIPVPLHLETQFGTFSNGQQSIDVVMNNGAYSTNFYAGTSAGVGTIYADIANVLSDQEQVRITSADPETIEMTSDVSIIQTENGETTAKLTVLVYDTYGNLLDSQFSVNLYTNVGEISPAVFQSAGGSSVSAILTVPPGTNDKAVLWAVVPGTRLLTKLTIDVTGGSTVRLPLIVSGQ